MAREFDRSVTRRIKLTYPQSLEVVEGLREAEYFTSIGFDFSPLSQVKPSTDAGRKRYEALLKTKFTFNPDVQTKNEQDTGWVIKETYEEVDWSKVAYRIGVREIGLHSFRFAEASSKVSVPIHSPKPIWKVVLKTVEDIPPIYDPQKAWIIYEVTFDGGRIWHRINPLDKPTRFADDGTVVPRVVTVNAEMPSADPETRNVVMPGEVHDVRLRYTLFADRNADPNGSSSPVLKNVKLMVHARGGLSGAQDQEAV